MTRPHIPFVALLAYFGSEKKALHFLRKFKGHSLPSPDRFKLWVRNAEIMRLANLGTRETEISLRMSLPIASVHTIIKEHKKREHAAKAKLEQKAAGPVPSVTKLV